MEVQVLELGGLVVDLTRRRVWVDGWEAVLTGTEYSLLAYLARHVGWVLPHDVLLEVVWGPECVGNRHLLQTTVSRLRGKIGAGYVVTRPGLGYCLLPGLQDRGRPPAWEG